jgi:5-methylcytosine-specific restriction endonuclease McrA
VVGVRSAEDIAEELALLDEKLNSYLASVAKCYWCGRDLTSDSAVIHLDHIIPVCEGGFYLKDNLVPACRACNLRKSGKLPWEFMPHREDLWGSYREAYERLALPSWARWKRHGL